MEDEDVNTVTQLDELTLSGAHFFTEFIFGDDSFFGG